MAIKVIRLLGYNDAHEREWLRDRLFREGRAAGSLCHPSIVTIYQVGEEKDVAYIAMEFVDGPTLQEIMQGESSADMASMCRILSETAAALDHAHHHGLVHRDIKPANIMVSVSGTTKVTDFGIAKSALSHTNTKTGEVLGTLSYMSPEQVRGEALDGRSDQFALAVIAYEIFTGRKPFQAEHTTSVCYQIIHQDPLSPEDVNPAIGGQLAAVIKRGLSKNPAARYSTCSKFAEALTAALTETSAGPLDPRKVSSADVPAEDIPAVPAFELQPARKQKQYRLFQVAVLTIFLLVVPVVAVVAYRSLHRFQTSTVQESPIPTREKMSGAGTRSQQVENGLPLKGGVRPQPLPSPKITPLNVQGSPPPIGPSPNREPKSKHPSSPSNPEVGAQIETRQPAPPPSPAPRLRGTVVWLGRVPKGTRLTIAGAVVSSGTLAGALPRRPIRIQVYPAEEGNSGLTVFTSNPIYATPAIVDTPRGRANFTFDPRHATDIVVFEEPGPHNNWERLVLQINNPKLSMCVIDWQE